MRAAPGVVRWAALLTGAGLLVVGSVLTALDVWTRDRSVVTDATWRDVAAAAGLLVLAGAVAAAAWCRREGRNVAATGVLTASAAALLPWWSASDWVPPVLVAPSLAAAPLVVTGLARVAREWAPAPGRRVWDLLAGLGVTGSVLQLVSYEPVTDPRCVRRCTGGLDLVGGADLGWFVEGWWLLSAVLLTLAAVVRGGGLPSALRAGLVSAGVALLLVVVAVIRWGPSIGGSRERLVLLAPVAAAVLGLGWHARDLARRRRELRQLVAGGPDRSGTATGAGLVFRVPGEGWVDAAGQEVSLDGLSTTSVLRDGDDTVVAQVSTGASPSPPDIGGPESSAGAVDEIMLRNAWGLAVVRARRRALERSRRRIVEVSDQERRRIERDLHDGVQQRLVGAQLHLALARGRLGDAGGVGLAEAERHISEALGHLRALCHGTFPRALATEGLVEALRDLAERNDLPVQVHCAADVDRLDQTQATALYWVADATLGQRFGQVRGTVELVDRSRDLLMRLDLHGVDVELSREQHEDLVDRVGAVGGSLEVRHDRGDLRVEVVVPCASSSPTT